MSLDDLIDRLADEHMRAIELEVDTALMLYAGWHPHKVARRRGQIRRYRSTNALLRRQETR
jgi:hypothetical protein